MITHIQHTFKCKNKMFITHIQHTFKMLFFFVRVCPYNTQNICEMGNYMREFDPIIHTYITE